MDWLIVGLLVVILIAVARLPSINAHVNALVPLAQGLDRVESKLDALQDEITALQDKLEQIENAVTYCEQSIDHLNKRFNRVDPYYRQEVDPLGLLDEETLFHIKKT